MAAVCLSVLFAVGVVLLWPPASEQAPGLSFPSSPRRLGELPFRPLSPLPHLNPAKVALGEALFNDPRLSKDNSVSCASCHILGKGGGDGRPVAEGIRHQHGEINTPTVFNVAFNLAQFWDGRAATLEQQVAGPVHNPKEMDSSWAEVVSKLRQQPAYVAQFREVFGDGVTGANVAVAIAEYERSLVSTDSRFDQWLAGKEDALSADEKTGYRLFREYGCASCHQGQNVGGNMFQKFGIFAPFRPAGRTLRQSDLGRYNVTGKEDDRGVFRVPSLRNVARTAPYFHDGSAPDLDAAISTMAQVQLGREIPPAERKLIADFLGTLTGKYQGNPL